MARQVKVKEPVCIRIEKLANGNESTYLDLYKDDDRVYELLKLYLVPEESKADKKANRKTLGLANTVKAKRIVELQNNEHGFRTNTTESKMNLIQLVLHLADEQLVKSGNKRGYYYTLHSLAKHLRAYAGDKITFTKVNTEFVKGFIAYLRIAMNFDYENGEKKSKYEALSQNAQYNLYKKLAWVIHKAMRADVMATNPPDKVDNTDKPRSEDGQREFLTTEEIKRLMNTPCKDDMLKCAFIFRCLVGLRYSDVKKLVWNGLYGNNESAIILRIRVTKTKRYEDLPISKEALKWLPERISSGDGKIFRLPKNNNSSRKLKHWYTLAGITKNVTFHVARHTAAILDLSLSVPIETISKLLGHTKTSTTQIYTRVIDANKKAAVHKQDGVFN